MGKGWAKGLTAVTDQRIANAAEAHRGLAYKRRTPIEQCHWPLRTWRTLPLAWSNEMAYVVGLTATDGCLYSRRRKVNFKSADRQLVATYLDLLARRNPIKTRTMRTGRSVHVTEFGDAELYRWLLTIGLTPRKSLTLGAIDVPPAFLLPLVRGLLDGDGSIINKTYRADTGRRDNYYWEWLLTKFASASKPHLEWLADQLKAALVIEGDLRQMPPREGRHEFWTLTYGKRASHVLLPSLYLEGAPCLERKRAIWTNYVARHPLQ